MLQHSPFSPRNLESSGSSTDKDNFEKLKDAYDACLNEDIIKEVGVTPLLETLTETSKHFASGDLSSALLYALKTGQNSLISADTGADDKDPDTVVVSISAPWSVGLPAKELYEDKKILRKYERTVTEVFAGLNPGVAVTDANVHALVEFEKKVAAATPDAEDRNDVTVSQTETPQALSTADTFNRNTTTRCPSRMRTPWPPSSRSLTS